MNETEQFRPAAPPGRFIRNVPLLLTSTLVLVVLAQILRNDLTWDDRIMFSAASASSGDLPGLLSVPFWSNAMTTDAALPSYWRPTTTLLLWFAAFIAGPSPVTYHLVSLLGAILAAFSISALLRTTYPSLPVSATVWAALLYLAHPVTAEVTCMALNVSDHLALATLLISLMIAIRFVRGNLRMKQLPFLSLLIFISCTSKEFGVLALGVPIAARLFCQETQVAQTFPRWRHPRLWIATTAPVVLFLGLRSLVLAGENTSDLHALSAQHVFLSIGASMRQLLIMNIEASIIALHPEKPLLWILSAACVIGFAAFSILQFHKEKRLRVLVIAPLFGFLLFVPSLLGSSFADADLFLPVRYVHLFAAGMLVAAFAQVARLSISRYRWLLPAFICVAAMLSFIRINQWRNEVSLFTAEQLAYPSAEVPWGDLLNAQLRNGHYDDAVVTVDAFQRKNAPLTSTEEGIRLRALSQIALKRDKDIQLATRLAHEALLTNPRSIVLLFNLVDIRVAAGHPEESLWFMKRALQSSWYTPPQQRVIQRNIDNFEKQLAANHLDRSGAKPAERAQRRSQKAPGTSPGPVETQK